MDPLRAGRSSALLESGLIETIEVPGGLSGYAAAWAADGTAATAFDVEMVPRLEAAPVSMPELGTVRLWAGAPLGSAAELLNGCAGILASEIDRASLVRRERDVRNHLAAYAGLRLLLAAALGCAPAELRFGIGRFGKPFLQAIADRPAPAGVEFNLSHSGDRVLVGIAAAPIGVDIEAIEDLPDREEIARSVFSPGMAAALIGLEEGEQRALFYRFWVLGEAFIKATGLGIGQGLDSFAFTATGAPRLTAVTPSWAPAGRWRFGLLTC